LTVSVPREYRRVQPSHVGAATRPSLDGAPSFQVLDDERPRPQALLFGGILSLLSFGALSILIGHAGRPRHQSAPFAQSPTPSSVRWSPSGRAAAQAAGDADEEIVVSGQTATTQAGPGPIGVESNNFHPKSVFVAHASQRGQTQSPQDAVSPRVAAVPVQQLDPAERQRVLDQAIVDLKQFYFDRSVAQKTADALLAHEKTGEYNAAADGETFANLLTRQMRDASHDMHLVVEYSRDRLPDRPQEPSAEDLARHRQALEQNNCFFEKVDILPGNIGYLKLNWFADLSICRPKAAAAMASLNNAGAVIFDLRDARGGDPASVKFIAAYLFDRPECWYSPRESPTEQSWTPSPIPESKLADKPVYVLTSASTLSGAEQFSFDLKMLERATLVGETTGGAAHAGVFHRIDDHFGMGIPEVKVVNPYSRNDWEGTGVEPNVKVAAADALQTAERLAEIGHRSK
jgi:hypothetical protein